MMSYYILRIHNSMNLRKMKCIYDIYSLIITIYCSFSKSDLAKSLFKKWIQILECPWILRVSCIVGFTLTLQETQSIHDSMNGPKIEFIAHMRFIINILNGFVGVYNGKAEKPAWHGQSKEQRLVLHLLSLSITTLVPLLANELDLRSVMRGQVSLAGANHICVIHTAMNGCKNSKVN